METKNINELITQKRSLKRDALHQLLKGEVIFAARNARRVAEVEVQIAQTRLNNFDTAIGSQNGPFIPSRNGLGLVDQD